MYRLQSAPCLAPAGSMWARGLFLPWEQGWHDMSGSTSRPRKSIEVGKNDVRESGLPAGFYFPETIIAHHCPITVAINAA
jgi:hypothetical protein